MFTKINNNRLEFIDFAITFKTTKQVTQKYT